MERSPSIEQFGTELVVHSQTGTSECMKKLTDVYELMHSGKVPGAGQSS